MLGGLKCSLETARKARSTTLPCEPSALGGDLGREDGRLHIGDHVARALAHVRIREREGAHESKLDDQRGGEEHDSPAAPGEQITDRACQEDADDGGLAGQIAAMRAARATG